MTIGEINPELRRQGRRVSRPPEVMAPIEPENKAPIPVSVVNGPAFNTTKFVPTVHNIPKESKKVLSANNKRNYLYIENKSASAIFVCFSAKVNANKSNGLRLDAGGFYETSTVCPANDINVSSVNGDQEILIIEGNY